MPVHFLAAALVVACAACAACADRSDEHPPTTAWFIDRARERVAIPPTAADALALVLARHPDRTVLAAAPSPPIGRIVVEREGKQSTYDFHGTFVLLPPPSGGGSGGVWEDPLFTRWDAAYRAADYHGGPGMFR